MVNPVGVINGTANLHFYNGRTTDPAGEALNSQLPPKVDGLIYHNLNL